jgi:hypothetical protein
LRLALHSLVVLVVFPILPHLNIKVIDDFGVPTFLPPYCSVKLQLTKRRNRGILMSSARMLDPKGVPNEEG